MRGIDFQKEQDGRDMYVSNFVDVSGKFRRDRFCPTQLYYTELNVWFNMGIRMTFTVVYRDNFVPGPNKNGKV